MTLLASRFRSRRLELKLSQSELAEGICKQGQISRIEKGKYNPGSDILYKLAQKLNVPMEYFFDENILADSSMLGNFIDLSKKLLNQRDYFSLKYLYNLEKEKNHKLPLYDQSYLSWIESIILFHCDNKKTEAIKKLETLLNKMSESDRDYFMFLNSLLNFYSYIDLENEKISGEMYQKIIIPLEKSNISIMENFELLVKVRYNYCRYLWIDNQIKEAISEILKTIDICKKFNHFYLLPDLFCLLGNVSEGFAKKDEVKKYFKLSETLYSLSGNEKMALTIENYIKNNLI